MSRLFPTFVLLCLAAGLPAGAQIVKPTDMPGPLKEVGFDQHLDAPLPLDAAFVDEEGRDVVLGDYWGGERPVVLTFVYYDCPMLCTMTMNSVAKSLDVVDLEVGSEIEVVVVSIDPDEGPAEALRTKELALERYGRPGSAPGWHFLTGSEASIRRLTETAGFAYAYLPENDEWAHTSGIIVTTPDGRIAQYFFGIDYPPKDVRLALVEASSGEIGSVIDQLFLYCFRFDPELGKYTAATLNVLRLAAGLTALLVLAYVAVTWTRERRKRHAPRPIGAA